MITHNDIIRTFGKFSIIGFPRRYVFFRWAAAIPTYSDHRLRKAASPPDWGAAIATAGTAKAGKAAAEATIERRESADISNLLQV
jgi:hypothetical protein